MWFLPLYLDNNELSSLPSEIGNLINLHAFVLTNNKLSSLLVKILKIINILYINESSYEINNLDIECTMGLEQYLLTSVMLYT